ncbi:hypothetical protein AAHC03_024543 [Spirometra sp. Aus1]
MERVLSWNIPPAELPGEEAEPAAEDEMQRVYSREPASRTEQLSLQRDSSEAQRLSRILWEIKWCAQVDLLPARKVTPPGL